MHKREVGRRQRRTIHRFERKRLGVQLVTTGVVLPAHPSRNTGKLQRRQIVRKLRAHVDKKEIGGQIARLALFELHPETQRALARVDRQWQRQIFLTRPRVCS